MNIELESAARDGGTFFDNLLDIDDINDKSEGKDAKKSIRSNTILRPFGPGHAVAHRSTERHAGAPTKTGIRELLVVFLTLRPNKPGVSRDADPKDPDEANGSVDLAGIERAFYLKNLVQQPQIPLPGVVQNLCYEWAIKNYPFDGESLFWTGRAKVQHSRQALDNLLLHERSLNDGNVSSLWDEMNEGIIALEKVAREADPYCIRSLLFLGTAYSSRWCFATNCDPNRFGLCEKDELEKAGSVLKRALTLDITLSSVLGSDDSAESASRATILLQLGEILLLQGQQDEAREVLSQIHKATQHLPANLQTELRVTASEMLDDATPAGSFFEEGISEGTSRVAAISSSSSTTSSSVATLKEVLSPETQLGDTPSSSALPTPQTILGTQVTPSSSSKRGAELDLQIQLLIKDLYLDLYLYLYP